LAATGQWLQNSPNLRARWSRSNRRQPKRSAAFNFSVKRLLKVDLGRRRRCVAG
jgi:hypothetical protein